MTKGKSLALFLIYSMSFFALSHQAYAQDHSTGGIAVEIPINTDKTIENGQIVSYQKGEYTLATTPYDQNIIGVVTLDPALYYDDTNTTQTLVTSSGEVFVLVSTENGFIGKGDHITSSSTPGIGQKATEAGQVVGIALEELTADVLPTVPQLILVQLQPSYYNPQENVGIQVNLIEALLNGLEAPFLTPIASLRYLLAALLVVVAFIIGFATFGKISGKGIEALGRNPLAKKSIQLTIVVNFVLSAVIMIAGLALAYFILVL